MTVKEILTMAEARARASASGEWSSSDPSYCVARISDEDDNCHFMMKWLGSDSWVDLDPAVDLDGEVVWHLPLRFHVENVKWQSITLPHKCEVRDTQVNEESLDAWETIFIDIPAPGKLVWDDGDVFSNVYRQRYTEYLAGVPLPDPILV